MSDPTLDLVRAVARNERPARDLSGICPDHGYLAVYKEHSGRLRCLACKCDVCRRRLPLCRCKEASNAGH